MSAASCGIDPDPESHVERTPAHREQTPPAEPAGRPHPTPAVGRHRHRTADGVRRGHPTRTGRPGQRSARRPRRASPAGSHCSPPADVRHSARPARLPWLAGELDHVDGRRPFCTSDGVGAVLGVFRNGGAKGPITWVVSLNQACPTRPFLRDYQGVRVECAMPGEDYSAAFVTRSRATRRATRPLPHRP